MSHGDLPVFCCFSVLFNRLFRHFFNFLKPLFQRFRGVSARARRRFPDFFWQLRRRIASANESDYHAHTIPRVGSIMR
ncbi:TPA: hypothetical protein ACTYDV_005674, partial [Serratia marcescens]